jgi:glutamine amidotransferase
MLRKKGIQKAWVFDIDVIKFTTKVKVPQMGWNQIYNLKSPLFVLLKMNTCI